MTYTELVKDLSAIEGKSVEVSIGNIKEILKCLTALEAAHRVRFAESPSKVFEVLERLVKAKMKRVQK